jgi:transcriptional regulator with XRE-family HTH domain
MPRKSRNLPPPAARRLARQKKFDGTRLAARLQALLDQRNESYRQAALAAGLDHQAVGRILREKMRPMVQTCILLANHFDINPNELLTLAGYAPLKVFDIRTATAEHLPPEAVEVALDIAKIADPGTRRKVASAIRALLSKYFEP